MTSCARFANITNTLNTNEYSNYVSTELEGDEYSEENSPSVSEPVFLSVNSLRSANNEFVAETSSRVPRTDTKGSPERINFYRKEKEDKYNPSLSAQIQHNAEITCKPQSKQCATHLKTLERQNASLQRELHCALAAVPLRESESIIAPSERVSSSQTHWSSNTPAQASDSLPVDSTLHQAIYGGSHKTRCSKRHLHATPADSRDKPSDSSDSPAPSIRDSFSK